MEKQKSPIVFALLAWFLGGFGAQFFYMGKTKAGLIAFFTNWLCLWASIVALIQCVMALVKGQAWLDKTFNNDKMLPIL